MHFCFNLIFKPHRNTDKSMEFTTPFYITMNYFEQKIINKNNLSGS